LASKRTKTPPVIEWAQASRLSAGSVSSRLVARVKTFPAGALAGVVGGVGPLPEAAVAAKTAGALLKRYGREPVMSLLKRCDKYLMMSHGAVLGLAWFSAVAPRLWWLGVGTVSGVLVRADPAARPRRESLRVYEGVVGYHFPPRVRPTVLNLAPGDTLVLASPELSGSFKLQADPQRHHSLQALADDVLAREFPGDTEALVLLARYPGRNHDTDDG
jgi:hypothetical protein